MTAIYLIERIDYVKVSMAQFKKALNMFIDNTYTPKVPASEYLMYFGKIAILNSVLTSKWAALADDDSMVNVEPFYEAYTKMFEHTDKVDFKGFTIDKNDLNELMGFIKVESGKKLS